MQNQRRLGPRAGKHKLIKRPGIGLTAGKTAAKRLSSAEERRNPLIGRIAIDHMHVIETKEMRGLILMSLVRTQEPLFKD